MFTNPQQDYLMKITLGSAVMSGLTFLLLSYHNGFSCIRLTADTLLRPTHCEIQS